MNQFCQRTMRPGETVSQYCHAIQKLLDRGCPGCEDNTRNRLLRLVANVPEHVKNFIELQAGTWDDIVKIIDKQVDYKTVEGPKLEVEEINYVDSRNTGANASSHRIVHITPQHRFQGVCNACNKFGQKAILDQ